MSVIITGVCSLLMTYNFILYELGSKAVLRLGIRNNIVNMLSSVCFYKWSPVFAVGGIAYCTICAIIYRKSIIKEAKGLAFGIFYLVFTSLTILG